MIGRSSDDELLSRARRDPAALEALYRRHVGRVMAYAARRSSRPEDVADVVAMTFVRVLEAADQYDRSRGEVLAWMLGIARNLASDLSRNARRERTALTRVAGRRSLDRDEIAELEQRIDAAREREEIEAALERLSPRDREVLWLIGHDELSYAQAAQVLEIAPAAFRMRLMRARRALHRELRLARDSAGSAASTIPYVDDPLGG
ncbi:MAG TPA: RNA polymerase sigma factor, partial [Solirubrobacteraceae bacterium]